MNDTKKDPEILEGEVVDGVLTSRDSARGSGADFRGFAGDFAGNPFLKAVKIKANFCLFGCASLLLAPILALIFGDLRIFFFGVLLALLSVSLASSR